MTIAELKADVRLLDSRIAHVDKIADDAVRLARKATSRLIMVAGEDGKNGKLSELRDSVDENTERSRDTEVETASVTARLEAMEKREAAANTASAALVARMDSILRDRKPGAIGVVYRVAPTAGTAGVTGAIIVIIQKLLGG